MADEISNSEALQQALVQMSPQERRRIQNAAMAGRDPTAQQQKLLDALLPQKEEMSARLAIPGAIGAELTGVPSGFRAASAARDMYENPSVANATALGTNAAMAAFRPVVAAKILGAGLGIGAAQDLAGALMNKAHAQQAKPQSKRFGNLPPEVEAEYDELKRKADNWGFNNRNERTRGEARMKDIEQMSRDLMLEKARSENQSKEKDKEADRVQFDRTVRFAEGERDRELARDTRFSETELGKVWKASGGTVPIAAGALTGALIRGAAGPGKNAITHALSNYVGPAVMGGVAGAASYNLPLAYNAFMTESDNPKRAAYEAYARELPPDHPRRQEWFDYARSLPEDNPLRRSASKEFYDYDKLKERLIAGGAEGFLGGMAGADLFRMPARLSKFFGSGTSQSGSANTTLSKALGNHPGNTSGAQAQASAQTTAQQAVVPKNQGGPAGPVPAPQPAGGPSQALQSALSKTPSLGDIDVKKLTQEMKDHYPPKGGTHIDHNWNSKAGRWQAASGKFLSGEPPKDVK